MPRYRTFSYIEEYIVSNLPYRVSRYALDMPLFCLFPPKILRKIRKFSGNSENSPEILRKFRKFAEISENSPKILKIRRKFIKKKVFLKPLYRIVSHRIEKKTLISYRYRIESKKSLSLFIESVKWVFYVSDWWFLVRMEAGATTRRFECPALPRGWIREEVYRWGLLSTSHIFKQCKQYKKYK